MDSMRGKGLMGKSAVSFCASAGGRISLFNTEGPGARVRPGLIPSCLGVNLQRRVARLPADGNEAETCPQLGFQTSNWTPAQPAFRGFAMTKAPHVTDG